MGTNTKSLATICAIATSLLVATPALAAGSSASANAVTLRPLSLVRIADLEFGSIIPSATAGTVTIDAVTNARSRTGGVTLAAGATPGAANFRAAGVVNVLALITLPSTIVLTRVAGVETMTVSNITTNGPTIRLFPGSATIDISVAGRLNVGANQAAGSYTGTFNLTVIYL